jgi:hypothetical protein
MMCQVKLKGDLEITTTNGMQWKEMIRCTTANGKLWNKMMHYHKWQVVKWYDALPQMVGARIYCDDDKKTIDYGVARQATKETKSSMTCSTSDFSSHTMVFHQRGREFFRPHAMVEPARSWPKWSKGASSGQAGTPSPLEGSSSCGCYMGWRSNPAQLRQPTRPNQDTFPSKFVKILEISFLSISVCYGIVSRGAAVYKQPPPHR